MARRLHSQLIYDSLVDDELFAVLPTRLAAVLDARSTLLHWHYGDGSADILSHSNYFTNEHLGIYATTFAPHDPWARGAARAQAHNVPMNLEDLVPPEEFERSYFYNEYIRPMGDDTFRCMGLRSETRWGAGMLALQRGKSQASFTKLEVTELGRYSEHLCHVLKVRGRLSGLQRQAASSESALNQIRDAVFITTADGRICIANAAGEALIEASNTFVSKEGRLKATDQRQHVELKEALHAACRSTEPCGDHLLFEREGWPPFIVAVTPVAGPNGSTRALLLINNETRAAVLLPYLLQRLFRLTRAEAEICCRMADGVSLTEISVDRQVSVGTVRSQLKSIAAKLGCRRQAEIVSLVKAIPLARVEKRQFPPR